MNRSFRKRKSRSGLATVELAVCLPLLLTLTLATVDVCSAIFVKESLTIAAYEGARVGAMRGATNNDVTTAVRTFLDQRGIKYSSASVVTISAPGFSSAKTLEHVTVTVTVPCADNLSSPKKLFKDKNLQSSVTVRKQFKNL
jgi:Flp pilus assembly protein TadG